MYMMSFGLPLHTEALFMCMSPPSSLFHLLVTISLTTLKPTSINRASEILWQSSVKWMKTVILPYSRENLQRTVLKKCTSEVARGNMDWKLLFTQREDNLSRLYILSVHCGIHYQNVFTLAWFVLLHWWGFQSCWDSFKQPETFLNKILNEIFKILF